MYDSIKIFKIYLLGQTPTACSNAPGDNGKVSVLCTSTEKGGKQ
jgi:hypothetical protein